MPRSVVLYLLAREPVRALGRACALHLGCACAVCLPAQANLTIFPSGIANLSDYVHSLGGWPAVCVCFLLRLGSCACMVGGCADG